MDEPHHLSPEVAQEMFTTIGKLSANWSMMDFSLDALISVLYHNFDGNKIEPELPREFKRKTRYLLKVLENPPDVIRSLKEKLISAIGKIGNLSQFRHDVIHGYPSRYDPKSKKFTFVSISPTPAKTHHQVHERHVTSDELLKIGKEALAIGAAMSIVTVQLLRTAYGEDELKDLLSRFRGE